MNDVIQKQNMRKEIRYVVRCWCYSTKMYGGAATKSAKTFQLVLNTLNEH